jgi:hypothetical protein
VVDLSDPGGYPSALVHLTELLQTLKETDEHQSLVLTETESNTHTENTKAVVKAEVNIPTVLLIFNKTDLADATTHAMAMSIFRLGEVIALYQTPRRCIQTFSGSCMNLQLAKVLLRWISNNEAA